TLPTLIGGMSIVASRQAFQSHPARVRSQYHRPDRRALTSSDFSQMILTLGARQVTRSQCPPSQERQPASRSWRSRQMRPPVPLFLDHRWLRWKIVLEISSRLRQPRSWLQLDRILEEEF